MLIDQLTRSVNQGHNLRDSAPRSLTTHGDKGMRRSQVSLEYLGYLCATTHNIPLLVLAFNIAHTGKWDFCTSVQYQYRQIPLPVLAFKNDACTGTRISALWSSTGICTVHYQNWHSRMVPIPVLSFLHIGSVLVKALSITGTGIQQWCRTAIGILVLGFSISIGMVHYLYWH